MWNTNGKQDALALVLKYRGAVMGFAALWIILFHEWQYVFAGIRILGGLELYGKQFGFAGVDIFLLLSGMGLTYAIGKGSLGSFYARRFKRLLPPFLAVGLAHLVIGKWDVLTFLGNVTGWNFYTKSVYSFLWFVPAIAALYLLFPLYSKLLDSVKRPNLVLAGTLALWLILSVLLKDTMRLDLYSFTNRIPVFLAGVWLGRLSRKKPVYLRWWGWGLVVLVFLGGLYLAWQTNFHFRYILVPISNCFLPNLLIALSLPVLLSKCLDLLSGLWPGKGIARLLAFFGTFSLEFYCVQEAIGVALIPVLQGVGASNWIINAAVLAAATAAGFLLHWVMEQLWKRLGEKRAKG